MRGVVPSIAFEHGTLCACCRGFSGRARWKRLAGKIPAILPMVIFVAAAPAGALLGFLEVGMRSHADGCDWSHAVGYVEGWFVLENARRRGIGAALLRAAEDWSRAQGCTEIASDTQIDNGVSQSAHQALGFEVAERAVLFRKSL